MKITKLSFNRCFLISPVTINDNRGYFVKTFNANIFSEHNLENQWVECYYSISHKNVIRGLHFQEPPFEHNKLVYCITGAVLDVLLDIRKNSPTYGQVISIKLDSENKNMLYIPKGIAHGFKSLKDNTTMVYNTSSVYNNQYDNGIRWDSCKIDWDLADTLPIVSQRDQSFIELKNFITPFN